MKNQSLKWGLFALFISAFADAFIFPAPVLSLFIFFVLLNSQKANNYIVIATLGTFLGALTGYFFGYFTSFNLLTESGTFVQFLHQHVPGFSKEGFNNIQMLYSKWNFWILFMASFSPIPYGLFSMSSGIFKINLPIFCVATLICQASKFWLLAVVTKRMGPRVKELIGWKSLPWILLLLMIFAFYFLYGKQIT